MPSSIVTAVPSGLVKDWCMQTPWFGLSTDERQECANSTRGTKESDFQTICCDGDIVDTAKDLFRGGYIDMRDMVCCRIQGAQPGGLMPLPTNAATECASGTPVPLVDLAATNTKNAQGYLVTYTSASYGVSTTGDFIPTQTPYCLWMNTHSDVEMSTVTLPAAKITTLSSTSYNIQHSFFSQGSLEWEGHKSSTKSTHSSGQSSGSSAATSESSNASAQSSPTSSAASASAPSSSSTTSSGSKLGLKDIMVLGVLFGWTASLLGQL